MRLEQKHELRDVVAECTASTKFCNAYSELQMLVSNIITRLQEADLLRGLQGHCQALPLSFWQM